MYLNISTHSVLVLLVGTEPPGDAPCPSQHMHENKKFIFYKLFCPPRMPFVKPRLHHSALTLPYSFQSILYSVRFIVILTWDISPSRLSCQAPKGQKKFLVQDCTLKSIHPPPFQVTDIS